jgi:hypothetical protein
VMGIRQLISMYGESQMSAKNCPGAVKKVTTLSRADIRSFGSALSWAEIRYFLRR